MNEFVKKVIEKAREENLEFVDFEKSAAEKVPGVSNRKK